MFVKQLTTDGYIWIWSGEVAAEEVQETASEHKGQTFLDLDPAPTLFQGGAT